MKTLRIALLLLTAPAVLLLAQAITQVNCPTQVRNGICMATYDNWLSLVPTPAANGTNVGFTIPGPTPRKVEVFLNGLRQQQQSEVLIGAPWDYTWAGNIINFQPAAIPQTGDTILVRATQ
jgi:hypothetical protein